MAVGKSCINENEVVIFLNLIEMIDIRMQEAYDFLIMDTLMETLHSDYEDSPQTEYINALQMLFRSIGLQKFTANDGLVWESSPMIENSLDDFNC